MRPVIEAESIPYQATELLGERLLVLAPHPDDEVIGCGGVLAQHLGRNRHVRIVVATDGAQGGDARQREAESRRGVALLGSAEMQFLGFPDRALSDTAGTALAAQLREFHPDLILVPSPIEIHPDHLALSKLFCTVVAADETLFGELALTRVAFYEVGQAIRPNTLVDITDVAESKYAAIAAHESQSAVRDYTAYARGLNAYRTMTLEATAKYAEAYFVLPLPELRTRSFSALRRMVGAPPEVVSSHERLPLSVVVRTKDRPALLREAIDSILATNYPCEIVVVNDGGAIPELTGVTLVTHETSRGRSEAANAGARAATKSFLAFLDDDDLLHADHFDTLAAAAHSTHTAWYTDAVSAFLRPGESGGYETHSRLRLYSQDYDPELLRVDNYIPLPTLLLRRETFLDLGGFDPAFDLFEDWDFLIRLSQRGPLLHVPRVTCEIRHFEGGSSAVLDAPEGSARFRQAKLQVWTKHAELLGPDVFATVFERQKKRGGTLYSSLIESRGQLHHQQLDLARLERERVALQNSVNGYMLRVRELEGAIQGLQSLTAIVEARSAEVVGLSHQVSRLSSDLEREMAARHEVSEQATRMHVEIERLNGLLDMIYRSKTWKVHTTVEKLRGRG
jgi:LmbE family N-acetylglucosaminyl deacetylase/GT2 family glycosyltransferase